LIEEAFYKKDHFVIERSGRPMAVLVPIDYYQKWQRLAKEQVFTMIEEVWRRTEGVPTKDLEADVEQALSMLRQELLAAKSPQSRVPNESA
jgi:hypothetical protein